MPVRALKTSSNGFSQNAVWHFPSQAGRSCVGASSADLHPHSNSEVSVVTVIVRLRHICIWDPSLTCPRWLGTGTLYPLSQLSLLSCQIRNFGTRSRFMLGLTSNTAMPWLFLEVMSTTEMFVTLPGSRRLHCCSNDLRNSAGLA